MYYQKYKNYKKKYKDTEKSLKQNNMLGGTDIKLKRLSGANTLYYYNVEGISKKILLLGEVHLSGGCNNCNNNETGNNCYSIDNYIDKLLDTKSLCIDFYKETYYFGSNTLLGGSYTNHSLDDSYTYWKNKSNLSNIRIHNWDLRHMGYIDSNGNPEIHHNYFCYWINNVNKYRQDMIGRPDYTFKIIENPVDLILELKTVYPDLNLEISVSGDDNQNSEAVDWWLTTYTGEINNYFAAIYDYISSDKENELLLNSKEYSWNIVQSLHDKLNQSLNYNYSISSEDIKIEGKMLNMSINKTNKSFRKASKYYIKEPNLLRLIYLKFWIDLIKDEMKVLILNGIDKTKQKYTVSLPLNINSTSLVELLTLPITDLYLLYRMFTVFDNTPEKNTKSPSGCKNVFTPENIIVYAGATHVSLINHLLIYIYKKQPTIIKENEMKASQKCINFDSLVELF